MQVNHTPIKIYLAPITQTLQSLDSNSQAVLYGDSPLSAGKAFLASSGVYSNPTSSTINPDMGIFLDLNDKIRICLGKLDNNSTKIETLPGETTICNSSGSYIKIDVSNDIQSVSAIHKASFNSLIEIVLDLASKVNQLEQFNENLMTQLSQMTYISTAGTPTPLAVGLQTNTIVFTSPVKESLGNPQNVSTTGIE